MNERILWDAIEVYLAVYFLIILPAYYCYRTMHNSKVQTRARQSRYTKAEQQQIEQALRLVKSEASKDALLEALGKTRQEYAAANSTRQKYTRHPLASWDHGEGDR